MNVSERIFDYLKDKTDCVFMVAGGQAMYLDDALLRSGIRYVPVHHEQTAGMAADAYGRLTNRLGVALVTAGPGAVNVMNGVVGGYMDSSPMMVISGQWFSDCVDYQRRTGIRQYGTQGILIEPLVRSVTKYFKTLDEPRRTGDELEKAYRLAKDRRPGPVWLDIPLDIQDKPAGEEMPYAPIIYSSSDNVQLEDIRRFEKPLLLAGQGVRIAGAEQQLRQVSERLDIPVITSRLGIDLLHYEHPQFVGHPGNYGDVASRKAIENADLILSVGCRLSAALVGYQPERWGEKAYKVVVDIDEKELDKPGVVANQRVNMDAKRYLGKLAEQPPTRHEQWSRQCQEWKGGNPVVTSELKKTLNSYSFLDKLSESASKDDVVVVDTGSCFHTAAQAWKIKEGQRYLTTGGLSSMGWWVASMGAAVTGKRTICITGDGSLQMNIQELATVKGQKLPIHLFVINNGGYGLIHGTQDRFMQGRRTDDPWFPDLQKIANAYELPYTKIDNLEILDYWTKHMNDREQGIYEVFVPKDEQLLRPYDK